MSSQVIHAHAQKSIGYHRFDGDFFLATTVWGAPCDMRPGRLSVWREPNESVFLAHNLLIAGDLPANEKPIQYAIRSGIREREIDHGVGFVSEENQTTEEN